MFERFTERARQVVVLAQDEARALKHDYIGTEHLLLGLLREEEGLASRVLVSLDVTVDEVRDDVEHIVGQGDEVLTGQIPLTPHAKKVLERGLREALMLGHNFIGTEHILLGLARENEGVAARILSAHGVTGDQIQEAVLAKLRGPVSAFVKEQTVPEVAVQGVQHRRAHITITTIDGVTITGMFVKWSDPTFMATGPQNQTTAWAAEDSDGGLTFIPWVAIRMLRVTPTEATV